MPRRRIRIATAVECLPLDPPGVASTQLVSDQVWGVQVRKLRNSFRVFPYGVVCGCAHILHSKPWNRFLFGPSPRASTWCRVSNRRRRYGRRHSPDFLGGWRNTDRTELAGDLRIPPPRPRPLTEKVALSRETQARALSRSKGPTVPDRPPWHSGVTGSAADWRPSIFRDPCREFDSPVSSRPTGPPLAVDTVSTAVLPE